jgi:hypothetical protein
MLCAATFTALIFITPAPSTGQWLNYPTAGVPKTPSGMPNLGAPTPRTADGHPDFSGIWEAENTLPCTQNDNCTDLRATRHVRSIGVDLPGGLPYLPWAADLVKQRSAGIGRDWPHSRCVTPNVVDFHTIPEFRKMVQTPGLILILNEFNSTYRQVFVDGRPLPVDPNPSWKGYSSGRWEGDTLVVETNGLRDDSWLDMSGDPMTEAAKVTERLRRLNYGNLEIELTVDDPKAYTRPWTVKLNQYVVLNAELLDYICLENEKDISHMVGR